jgi:hypothetical protein
VKNREKDKGKQNTRFGQKKQRKTGTVHPIKKNMPPGHPNGYLLFFFFTILISFILTYNLPTRSIPGYQLGDICRWDIKAPKELMVIDQEQTEFRRKQAMKNVLPVFDYDTDTVTQKIATIQTVFQTWRDRLFAEEQALLKRNEQTDSENPETAVESVELNMPAESNVPSTPLPEVILQEFKIPAQTENGKGDRGIDHSYPESCLFQRHCRFKRRFPERCITGIHAQKSLIRPGNHHLLHRRDSGYEICRRIRPADRKPDQLSGQGCHTRNQGFCHQLP